MYKVGILGRNFYVIGYDNGDGTWRDACFIQEKFDQENGGAIRFDPVSFLSENRDIHIQEEHFLAIDFPSEEVITMWQSFVSSYHKRLAENNVHCDAHKMQ